MPKQLGVEQALGDGIKRPTVSESKNIVVARKSIVAKKAIQKGERFSEENLTVKRPGTGISPVYFEKILGTTAQKDILEDQVIDISSTTLSSLSEL